ncbi:MAG: DUF2085 domain-containing protein [Thermanaerothrix sp.]|uniref:DUF2085 domain-containing protein n=1 Tax=Thermanaerothrix solaris TaxID=3058434 RepID=A0ABU3NMR1_9CHLR|nr:DUF2085 domain-containing protein [Thermanaerothrix sp. 4228-RoL]MDT8898138.1 DUF2085 domain-containing protein [Thermanaerothrix sp. 4228-RoL]
MHALERHPWLRGGLIAFALGLLTAWLIYTPPGLLGKADAIGYAVCHRSPAHSFFVGERQLPLCARCSGTFLAALIGLIVQLPRGQRAGWPSFPLQWVVIVLGLAFALDGVNSFLSLLPGATALYPPNNALRLASGSGFGAALAILLYPFINQILWAHPIPEAALATPWQGLGLFAAVAAGALGIYARLPWLTLPLAFLSTVGVIILLSLCYTLLWVILLQRENTFTTWRGLGGFLLAGLTTALLHIVLVDAGRFFLTGTWAGFMFP